MLVLDVGRRCPDILHATELPGSSVMDAFCHCREEMRAVRQRMHSRRVRPQRMPYGSPQIPPGPPGFNIGTTQLLTLSTAC